MSAVALITSAAIPFSSGAFLFWNEFADFAYINVFLHRYMVGEERVHDSLHLFGLLRCVCCQNTKFAITNLIAQPLWISVHIFSKDFSSRGLSHSNNSSKFFLRSFILRHKSKVLWSTSGSLRFTSKLEALFPKAQNMLRPSNRQIVCRSSVFLLRHRLIRSPTFGGNGASTGFLRPVTWWGYQPPPRYVTG